MLNKGLNFLTIWFFMLVITSLSAQTSSNAKLAESLIESDTDIIFPSTENEHIYYLDLEKIEGQLLDASVIEDAEIVEQVNLMEVRKDAFYELNLSGLDKGNYKIRIRTFQQEYKFEVQVQ